LNKLIKKTLIDPSIEECIDATPKPVGSLGYDAWGYNGEEAKLTLSLVKPFYKYLFRVETFGLENIPVEGRMLAIANHSGYAPIDAGLLIYALATNKHAPRAARAMVERFLPMVPFVGNQINAMGAVLGDPLNCQKMLQADEAVVVFPEGVRGTGKDFKDRYKLQRFGNGFLHMAMENETPIIPVGIVGCEESLPMLGNFKSLAKLLNIPYFPLALPFPLPTKVFIHIGEPMYFKNGDDTEEEIAEKVEEVKAEIDRLISEGLNKRKGIFR
jgi:1-acyl-sn-glycerol-3-phosphate acyltransferase